jgi:hypothetical protein
MLTFFLGGVLSFLSGDTVRAGYLLAVGMALTWDHAYRGSKPPTSSGTDAGEAPVHGLAVFSAGSAQRRQAAMRRVLVPAALAGVAYATVVGSFQRYSWPATVAVTIVAIAAVLVAWKVSAGTPTEPERLPALGAAAWAVVWVGAASFEVTNLFLQPNLTTDSYAHPTISYLANSLLAYAPGRSVVLFGWLAFGWYLARR